LREEEIDRNTPRDSLIEEEKYEGLEKILNTLTEREKIVLQMRTMKGETLEVCGRFLKLSRERIRQIESKALRKLRHPSRANKLIELFGLEIEPKQEETYQTIVPYQTQSTKTTIKEIEEKEDNLKRLLYAPYRKSREELLAEIELREFWEKRQKFTVVYMHKPDHPYFWSSTTQDEKSKRIIGYKDYYKTNFEELKLIFNEADISMAIAYLHGQRSELEGTLGEESSTA
jgi:DNA-binding CsgD family transcriptional regulator